MTELQVGTTQTFTVSRVIETGYVLGLNDQEVLLHTNEAAKELEVGEDVLVFLYHTKKGTMAATMSIPTISFERYDWVEVKEAVRRLGVFVDIGISKDILVSEDDLPLFEQVWPQAGDKLFVCLSKDQKGRLLAKPATENVMEGYSEPAPESVLHQFISGHIYRSTKVGSFLMTEEGYRGFIHYSERKEEPRLGEWVKGRVIDVKSVGSINVSLRPVKEEALGQDAEDILAFMNERGGKMFFTDKSDPEEIRDTFDISKAAFKRALGRLLKQGKIEQNDGLTTLKDSE
ncbi:MULTISPECIES: CvfB family protein [Pontibacillus]|uniref:S1-like domain-containing RNA-binding protein n=1 Tax=Pontibacillus chungwhensis TaxID=265426 RepID=A0ABY8USG8_9BACI|nr:MULTISPECIES: S1-like domain-containing RNA-binding protein [Pontibacillus]MCD5322865.1 S1-like domain-containing RNA-binding protein [Pontibacillus sp. HN14]WIF96263.1 S1-like domain-containing RNA-binding protein [Pontibacillus chungwhensis]